MSKFRNIRKSPHLGALCRLALPVLLAALAGCRDHPAGVAERRPLPYGIGQQLRTAIDARTVPAGLRRDAARRETWAEMRRFYRKRLFLPAWSDGSGPLPGAEELVSAIDGVAADGMDPRLYRPRDLARMIGEARVAVRSGSIDDPAVQSWIVNLDVDLTCIYLTLARQLADGRIRPQALPIHWYTRPRPIETAEVLHRTLAGRAGIAPSLAALAPATQGYLRLRQALAAYRAIAARGGWTQVPPGDDLRPGDRGARVAALRARLAVTGDLAAPKSASGAEPAGLRPADAGQAATTGPIAAAGTAATAGQAAAPARQAAAAGPISGAGQTVAAAGPPPAAPATPQPAALQPAASDLYDRELAAAVARFRARHGLEPGSSVDADTLQELDVPVEQRIRQIEVNMERWRWLPGDLGTRYLLVNVPDYRLAVVDGGRAVLGMRVIVGKAQSETPVFSDVLTHIVLNPAWALPDSIVAKEVVPKALADPGYLRRKGLQLVRGTGENAGPIDAASLGAGGIEQLGRPGSPFRLRQPPGGDNPLGRIKFLFPNRFDVYLHDTPSGRQFASTERDFSHGCIRLERPFALADYLLAGDRRWDPRAVAEAVAGGRTTTIAVPRPMPVHILYWTAWAEPDGTVQFRRDVYGHDATLAEALDREPPLWRRPASARGELPDLTARAAGPPRRAPRQRGGRS